MTKPHTPAPHRYTHRHKQRSHTNDHCQATTTNGVHTNANRCWSSRPSIFKIRLLPDGIHVNINKIHAQNDTNWMKHTHVDHIKLLFLPRDLLHSDQSNTYANSASNSEHPTALKTLNTNVIERFPCHCVCLDTDLTIFTPPHVTTRRSVFFYPHFFLYASSV